MYACLPNSVSTRVRRLLASAAFLGACLVAAPSTAAPSPDTSARQGTAIVIGGALRFDNHAVWKRVVDEAGGKGARFAVFGTASGTPELSAEEIVNALNAQGAYAEFIPVAPRLAGANLQRNLNDAALINKVRSSQGIFFSGGAQELIVDTLQPGGQQSAMLQAIWEVYRRGGVVAGSSAGAAVMSTTMFRDAPDPLMVLKGQLRDGREMDQGLGFVGPNLFVDQHFLKRGRIGRMLPLMVAKDYKLGVGIEENSAIVLHGMEMEVIGAKGALLVDLNGATSDPALGAFNLRGAQLSFLDHGDRYNLRTATAIPSAAKNRMVKMDPPTGDDGAALANTPHYLDILGDNTITNAMARLLYGQRVEVLGLAFNAGAPASSLNPDLGFEFRLYKGEGSVGYANVVARGDDNYFYTLLKLRLDVTPVVVKRPLYTPLTPLN
ncbi:cyanophycinase [Paucibacter sp. R3-3]|uniref:Cyanophycinase n=1 Tax=Roseateles agri TaxID=3098619 RepID=A0ABU5DK71_9BURK|nr:cyanophycinase [Paucibacter sp. R3-3]MDY0746698.1 cyanophycinase [Paucibacter sp. R3-3]